MSEETKETKSDSGDRRSYAGASFGMVISSTSSPYSSRGGVLSVNPLNPWYLSRGIPNFSPYAKLQKKRVLEDSGEDKSSNLTPKSDMKKQKIETTKANITQRISEEKEKNKILEAKLFQSLISPAGISSSASSSPSVTSPIPPLLVASTSDATRNGKKE